MSVQILRGDARHLPLADNTVDLVVTSPPYFALRSYTDQGAHYGGQIGSESTPAEWLAALLQVTGECVRVLKPSGSLFVNLGDKYAGSRMDGSSGWDSAPLDHDPKKLRLSKLVASQGTLQTRTSIGPKSLMGLPWRYALACIDQLGLILRAEIIWSKPNGLPESVTDRVRRSHETWFHFVQQPRYYSAVDEIREGIGRPPNRAELVKASGSGLMPDGPANRWNGTCNASTGPNPLGKLPGSVWTIPSEPLTVPAALGVDHFAAYPLEWPRRIIRGWCPAEVCTACGEGRRPVADKRVVASQGWSDEARAKQLRGRLEGRAKVSGDYTVIGNSEVTITGYKCACTPHPPTPTTPGVVLDPFGGTGTTALAALALGRDAIHVDLSADYNRIAAWRCTDRDQLAKAMQVTRDEKARDNDLYNVDPLFEVTA